jgi:hypothetical protein
MSHAPLYKQYLSVGKKKKSKQAQAVTQSLLHTFTILHIN